jgi:hemerythrin
MGTTQIISTKNLTTPESGYRKFDEPWFSRHINLHRELMRRTIDIARDPKVFEDPHIALKFLKEWWLDHINVEDRQYVAYVKEKM